MNRKFSKRQKIAMYIAQDGICAMCGNELLEGWHADHIHPYSKGGKTDILNGQALCPECNLKKGDKVKQTISLREWQIQAEKVILDKLRRVENKTYTNFDDKMRECVSFWEVPPGGGKTMGWLNVADAIQSEFGGYTFIDLTPRIVLSEQAETDWKEYQQRWHIEPTLRKISYRKNSDTPLIVRGMDGYSTTYQSVVSSLQLHINQIEKSNKIIVIADEAHLLGASVYGVDMPGNAAAECLRIIFSLPQVKLLILLSGSAERADGAPIVLAPYKQNTNQDGIQELMYDIRVTYSDGIRDGYLRLFESHQYNIEFEYTGFDGSRRESINDYTTSLSNILSNKTVYEGMTDKIIDCLYSSHKNIDSRFCAVIGASNQSVADKIYKYIKSNHRRVRVGIAISDDGKKAQKDLRDFKRHKFDVLVTVQMAYIGYNHPWISVVGILSPFRTYTYLRQFAFRGGRRVYELPYEKQRLDIIAPDDEAMNDFVLRLRQEKEAGMKLRDEKQEREKQEREYQPELVIISDVEITGKRLKGNPLNGDMQGDEITQYESLRGSIQGAIGLPLTLLKAIRSTELNEAQTIADVIESPVMTDREIARNIKSEIKELSSKCDYWIFGATKDNRQQYGETYKALAHKYGIWVGNCDPSNDRHMEILHSMLKDVKRWLMNRSVD